MSTTPGYPPKPGSPPIDPPQPAISAVPVPESDTALPEPSLEDVQEYQKHDGMPL